MSEFEIGDEVVCIEDLHPCYVGRVYRIVKLYPQEDRLGFEGLHHYWFKASHFRPKNIKPQPVLTPITGKEIFGI